MWKYIGAMSKAAVASGASGLMIEVHPCPEKALSDGYQSLSPQSFMELMDELEPVAAALGKTLGTRKPRWKLVPA